MPLFPNRILAFCLAFTLCTETLAESSITAGGKNMLINAGEQVLEGAKVHGDSGVYLKGSKTSLLAARLRNMRSDYEYDEGTFTNSTDADGHDNTTHAHSNITGSEVVVDSEAIKANYTRQFGLKDSGGFSGFGHLFEDLSDTGLSGANKPAWAKQVEASGKTVQWNPLSDSSESWSVHKEVLNQEFSTLVSLAAAVGTMAAGGFGVFAAGGATAGGTAGATAVVTNASMMSTIGTAIGQSALVDLASKGSVSLINNQFDLSKVAGDLTSKESLKGLGLNMATAGLTAGIGHGLGLKDIAPGLDMAGRSKILAQQGLISGAVRTGLAGATGDKPGQTWKDEALSIGLALAQSKIGDIAQDNALKSGSFGKTALHTGAGSLYSLATGSTALSGAIGGASSEIVASFMESGSGLNGPPSDVPLTPEQAKINADKRINLNNNIKATTKLASATATMLAGGNAKDITLSANVGESALKYNRRLHPEELKYIKALQEGKTPEEHARYAAAALNLVKGDKGISDKDPNYQTVKNITEVGGSYAKEQQELLALAKADGNGNAFTYGFSDSVSDFVSRNNELVSRSTGGVKFGLGSVGVMASAGLGTVAVPVTGGGSAPLSPA